MSNQVYICDPELNTECSKSHCMHNPLVVKGECQYTKNIMFAKKPVTKVVLVIPIDKTDKVMFDIHTEDMTDEEVAAEMRSILNNE